MRAAAVFLLACAACGPSSTSTTATTTRSTTTTTSTSTSSRSPDTDSGPATSPATSTDTDTDTISGTPALSDPPPLLSDPPDKNPASDTVTIHVIIDQRRKAHVFWGLKDFGEAPLDITRPRGSGPLDLVARAPGCLPLHARAFTDRDDKLVLRLYEVAEAPQLLGYRPEQETLQNKPQNVDPRGQARGQTTTSRGARDKN